MRMRMNVSLRKVKSIPHFPSWHLLGLHVIILCDFFPSGLMITDHVGRVYWQKLCRILNNVSLNNTFVLGS